MWKYIRTNVYVIVCHSDHFWSRAAAPELANSASEHAHTHMHISMHKLTNTRTAFVFKSLQFLIQSSRTRIGNLHSRPLEHPVFVIFPWDKTFVSMHAYQVQYMHVCILPTKYAHVLNLHSWPLEHPVFMVFLLRHTQNHVANMKQFPWKQA